MAVSGMRARARAARRGAPTRISEKVPFCESQSQIPHLLFGDSTKFLPGQLTQVKWCELCPGMSSNTTRPQSEI